MIRLRLYILGKNTTKAMCNIVMGFITGDFKLEYLVRVVSAEFLYYKITMVPFVYDKHFGGDSHAAIY